MYVYICVCVCARLHVYVPATECRYNKLLIRNDDFYSGT